MRGQTAAMPFTKAVPDFNDEGGDLVAIFSYRILNIGTRTKSKPIVGHRR